jgi:hypothetical protein
MIPKHLEALQSLSLLFIDCGSRDQYHLQYGARQMREELLRHGIEHVYAEFPDNHSSIDYRMDMSLPQIYRAISKGLG